MREGVWDRGKEDELKIKLERKNEWESICVCERLWEVTKGGSESESKKVSERVKEWVRVSGC